MSVGYNGVIHIINYLCTGYISENHQNMLVSWQLPWPTCKNAQTFSHHLPSSFAFCSTKINVPGMRGKGQY